MGGVSVPLHDIPWATPATTTSFMYYVLITLLVYLAWILRTARASMGFVHECTKVQLFGFENPMY